MRLCDVGAAIQEVMESYEVEINGKVYQGMMLLFIVFILFYLVCTLHVSPSIMHKYRIYFSLLSNERGNLNDRHDTSHLPRGRVDLPWRLLILLILLILT